MCRLLGGVLGWASSVFYLGSRVSQICKNISRRSAEGLSLAILVCAICANITYGLGILLRTYSWHYLKASLPWILGSLGTVALDVCIFCQASSPSIFDQSKHISGCLARLLGNQYAKPLLLRIWTCPHGASKFICVIA